MTNRKPSPSGTVTKGVTRKENRRRLAALREQLVSDERPATRQPSLRSQFEAESG